MLMMIIIKRQRSWNDDKSWLWLFTTITTRLFQLLLVYYYWEIKPITWSWKWLVVVNYLLKMKMVGSKWFNGDNYYLAAITITSPLLGSNILLIIPFSNTPNCVLRLNVRNNVSHPSKTTRQTDVSYILFFTFVDSIPTSWLGSDTPASFFVTFHSNRQIHIITDQKVIQFRPLFWVLYTIHLVSDHSEQEVHQTNFYLHGLYHRFHLNTF